MIGIALDLYMCHQVNIHTRMLYVVKTSPGINKLDCMCLTFDWWSKQKFPPVVLDSCVGDIINVSPKTIYVYTTMSLVKDQSRAEHPWFYGLILIGCIVVALRFVFKWGRTVLALRSQRERSKKPSGKIHHTFRRRDLVTELVLAHIDVHRRCTSPAHCPAGGAQDMQHLHRRKARFGKLLLQVKALWP